MRRRISVLLVEDDEDDFIMTQALLSEIDDPECALTWVQTFEEGLSRLVEGSFDVCLLDYALGERTGMELLAQSASAGVEVPIIFLTAQDERRLDLEATRLGAADYLVKSRIRADLLERSIRYALEWSRSLAALRVLNRELELTRDQAVRANQAKNDLLTAVSHAYRESLGTIVACNDAIEARLAGRDAVAEGYAREVREACRTLERLLTDVLDLSTSASEAPAVQPRVLALAPFVEEVVAASRPLVGHNDNTLEVACEGDLGAIETDPAHLRRVLLTLLANTCKFARRGRIQLSVVRRPLEGASGVEFAIRPSGLWMTPAQLELLFASIPQADPGVAPRGGWTESGIAASRRMCRWLGGELFVETEGVRRTVLRVWVPERRAAEGEHRPS
ncbi:Signal transduction histidine kinase [Nannocystis exedens]|uniref:histidine kinase n=1 Tax=Nannocystis exedens TaxID=54 RepID=A0A1I2D092_9BACT|nr:hybrid sensor histidine kinase/response regulator [Nannocystis exedens]PCC68668.1 hybrid sensor histidine kinase/response regulator [Nannocystis exedens]SFE73453.1 Signal transduction histidine kinase [Nannocystis exedens]